MVWDIVTLIVVPALRSVGGWLEKSLEDGKIDLFEWKKLGATILRIGLPVTFAYFGLEAADIHVDVLAVAGGGFIVDWLISKLKKPKV